MGLIDLIFPKRCLKCGGFGLYLCKKCTSKMKPCLPQCFICRRISNNYHTHSSCTEQSISDKKELKGSNINVFHPSSVTILWEYGEIGRTVLSEAKYMGSYDIYKNLSEVLAHRLLLSLKPLSKLNNSYIQPLPQHRQRSVLRGFDHTHLLSCTLISALIQTGCCKDLTLCSVLEKTKNNKRQASLNRETRVKNVKDAYRTDDFALEEIPPQSTILLIDDVMTTGSTITEATRVLKSGRPDLDVKALVLFRGSARFKDLPKQNPTGQIISNR